MFFYVMNIEPFNLTIVILSENAHHMWCDSLRKKNSPTKLCEALFFLEASTELLWELLLLVHFVPIFRGKCQNYVTI